MTIGKTVDNGKGPRSGGNRALAAKVRRQGKPPRAARGRKPARRGKNPQWLREGRYPPGRLTVYPVEPGEKEGYIYIAQAEKDIKVGFAFCAIKRLRFLNCGRKPLRLVRVIRMNRRFALLAELLAHKILKPKLSTELHLELEEWYSAPASYVCRVVNFAVRTVLEATLLYGSKLKLRHVLAAIKRKKIKPPSRTWLYGTLPLEASRRGISI